MLNPKKISNLIGVNFYNMSLRAQRGNLISSIGERGDCFVVPPRDDM